MAHPADSPQSGTAATPTRVGTALAQLDELDRTPLSGHPDVYQRIHAELQGALAEIDDA